MTAVPCQGQKLWTQHFQLGQHLGWQPHLNAHAGLSFLKLVSKALHLQSLLHCLAVVTAVIKQMGTL